MANHIEYATTFQAGRCIFVDEQNRDVDRYRRILVQAHEIDMQRAIGDGMKRDVLWQSALLLAAHFNFDNAVHEMACHQQLDQRFFLDMDCHSFLFIAVYNSRYPAFAAQCTGGSLASPFARLSQQCQQIAHKYSPNKKQNLPHTSRDDCDDRVRA